MSRPNEDEYATEAAAVARVSAEPTILEIPGDDEGRSVTLYPPEWSAVTNKPHEERQAPLRASTDITLRTAEGFIAEMKRLAGPVDPIVVRTQRDKLVGNPDPTSLATPTFDQVRVRLEPTRSPELTEWVGAEKKKMKLQAWEDFIEDHMSDIDAALDIVEVGAKSGAEVLADARNWVTEVRVTTKRIRDDATGDLDAAEELKQRTINEALRGFHIVIPVFTYGEPETLLVRIDRHIDSNEISVRIPGLTRLEDALLEQMFADAAGGVGVPLLQ